VTGREFSEVDTDLLADYVGGALDGTPEEATIARLVADDPAWARAYAELSAATAAVRDDLTAWGGTVEPMPADIADRIGAALANEPLRPALTAVPGGRTADGDRSGSTTSRAPRRRRWPAWGTPAAVAAGIAVVAGFGISQLGGLSEGSQDTGSSTAEAPAAAGDQAGGAAPQALVDPTWQALATGHDYRSTTLSIARAPASDMRAGENQPFAGQEAQSSQLKVADPLRRLTDPAALNDCLYAIAQAHNRGAATVQVVDFARYEGEPALVVFFTDGNGERWVWASGPDCGLPGSGPETRGSAALG
jgi:negative regulator of sigma E activity